MALYERAGDRQQGAKGRGRVGHCRALRGAVRLYEGRVGEASADLRDPPQADKPWVDRLYGVALARRGELEQATEVFTTALLADDRQASAATEAVLTRLARGFCHLKLGRVDAAVGDLSRVVANCGPDDAAVRRTALTVRANCYLMRGSHDLAEKDYDAVLASEPSHAECLTGKGLALFAKGNLDAALELLSKVINARMAACKDAWLGRALVRAELGRYEGALLDCDVALAIDPHYGESLAVRAGIQIRLAKPLAALEDLTALVSLNPAAESFCERGKLLVSLGRASEGLKDLSAAIARGPGYADAYLHRGLAHSLLGDHQAACADLDKAVELSTELNKTALYHRAVARARLGLLKEAVADLSKAIAIDRRYKEALCARGWCHIQMKMTDRAMEDLNRAIAEDQGYSHAIAMRNSLRV
jgi:tetratricopeptide (TPR) repeat protein